LNGGKVSWQHVAGTLWPYGDDERAAGISAPPSGECAGLALMSCMQTEACFTSILK
jgi:hypothetical protein